MSLGKVCVSGSTYREFVRTELTEAGCDLVLGKSDEDFPQHRYTDAAMVELIGDADILLVPTRDRVSRAVLAACPRLRAVVKGSIGVDKVDIDAASELGILVCNSPAPENFIGLAEATVGLIVDLFKRLKFNEEAIRTGGWKKDKNVGELMLGRTVGFIGMGRVGRNVAQRFQGWGLRLIAHDPYIKASEVAGLGVELTDLQYLLQEADVVTVHVVMTPETHRMLGYEEFRMMKRTAYVVNTARGTALHQFELAKALEEGLIAGAALDVFEDEPLPADDPLRSIDPTRLILTPHIVGNNYESRETGNRMAVKSVIALMHGRVPEDVLNPEAIPLWQERLLRLKRLIP